jgi:excisionase family DNA binding protein
MTSDDLLLVPDGVSPVVCIEPITVRPDVAAKLLGVSKPKVYELAARDDFHGAFKLGGCTLFSVEALRQWVTDQCGGE